MPNLHFNCQNAQNLAKWCDTMSNLAALFMKHEKEVWYEKYKKVRIKSDRIIKIAPWKCDNNIKDNNQDLT